MAAQNIRLGDAEFDEYADPEAYDAALDRGISISGEDKSYFARGRVAWLADCLKSHGLRPAQVLDFGCGTGTATPFLLDILEPTGASSGSTCRPGRSKRPGGCMLRTGPAF